MKRAIACILTALYFILISWGQVTSEWRNIGRTGEYSESGLMKVWPAGGPPMIMSVTGLPKGNSSVTIGRDKLFITGATGEYEVLIAMDMQGHRLWETTFGRAWTESYPESRCTPTLDGDRLYVTSGVLDAACIDAETGKTIWTVRVNEKFEGAFGRWGKAESPLVIGDLVYFTPAGDKTTMVALNKMTGETVWESESLKDISSYVSPLLVNYNGLQFIAGVTDRYIFAISPADGRLLWKYDYGSSLHLCTPVYADGCLFVSTGYDHGNVMLKLSPDGKEPTLLWKDDHLDTHHGGYVRVGHYLYGSNWLSNSKGRWVCIDWNTGQLMYETDWINKGPIITAGGMLYCYEEKSGNIALVRATPEKFDKVSSFKVPLGSGPNWSHPMIHGGILYIRHGDALMAFDIREKTGQ